MPILILFAFLGGLVTILSPCILPLLPIVLGASAQEGKKRPLGVVSGFIISFTFFTLFLTSIVRATGLPGDTLRNIAAITILVFGLVLTIPKLLVLWESLASRLANRTKAPRDANGFKGGFAIGISLGLVWTPCVGPILASIITLAATSQVGLGAVVITAAYSAGTAIPLFFLIYGGNRAVKTMPYLKKNSPAIQKIFGLLMILTALALYTGFDRRFQSYILDRFPEYGAGLTSFENTPFVESQINKLKQQGDPMNNLKTKLLNATNPPAPEISGGGKWFNSDPLTLASLQEENKIVLIDFWTYSCINCIRTLPHLKAWHAKYAPLGLAVIGVHSPEFEFEKDPDNVQKAIQDFGIPYPVVQDNDFQIWRAFNNHYWPAKYLIDKEGRIRYTHFGEGEYEETERWIQKLLEETGKTTDKSTLPLEEYLVQTRSPETYLGYWRISGFVSPEGVLEDQKTTYSLGTNPLSLNTWGFSGDWTIRYQHSEGSPNSSLSFRFHAKAVHLVMRPIGEPGTTVKILLDGKPIVESSGDDVKNGLVKLDGDRLYNLFKAAFPEEHTLTIEFPEGNAEVYAFTFG